MKPAQGFGVVLRQYRIAAGLTQLELAERSGLSVRAVSDMERGRTAPYARSVRLLVGALGLAGPAAERLLAERRRGAGQAGSQELALRSDGLWHLVPRQLPAPVQHFTGRAAELRMLSELLGQAEAGSAAVPIAVITGGAGVGKTALALHWAHLVAGRFGDGQLYVNLRGLDPSAARVGPSRVVCGFLAALGVPAGWIPATIDEQAALLRTVMAGRNILLVADNAQDADQVRPLLPGSSSCFVMVTSRCPMTELVAEYGAQPVIPGPLTQTEALSLLSRILGPQRLASDPAAAGKLISAWAGMPLALTAAAALAVVRPGLALSGLSRELLKPPSASGTGGTAAIVPDDPVVAFTQMVIAEIASRAACGQP